MAKAEYAPSCRSAAAGAFVCLLAGLLLLAACEEDKTPEKPLTAVRVHVLTSQDHDNPPRYSANIVAQVQVDVAFKVNGYITALAQRKGVDGKARALQQGDSVEKGDFLAQVQKDDYENKVKGAKAQLAEAAATLQQQSADFKRAKQLFDSQSITAQEFDRKIRAGGSGFDPLAPVGMNFSGQIDGQFGFQDSLLAMRFVFGGAIFPNRLQIATPN